MRAKGLCFICKQEDHLARNCPTHNTIRLNNAQYDSSTSSNVSIGYTALDELADHLESNKYIELESITDYETDSDISSSNIHLLSIWISFGDNTEDSVMEQEFRNANYAFKRANQVYLRLYGTTGLRNSIANVQYNAEQYQIHALRHRQLYSAYNDILCLRV